MDNFQLAINPINQLGQDIRRQIFQDDVASSSEAALDGDSKALAKLASLDPNAANVVGQILGSRNEEARLQAQQEVDRNVKVALSIQGQTGDARQAMIRRHMLDAQSRGDRAGLQELIALDNMTPEQQDIEIARDVTMGSSVKDALAATKSPDLIKLGAGDVLVDPASRQTIAENPDALGQQRADAATQQAATSAGNLQLSREQFEAKQSSIAGGLDDESFKRATTLRKEFTTNSKPFTEQAAAIGRIRASVQDESGASDMSLIFNFMKVLDPGSTVREGEFATAAQTGGIPDRVVSIYNKAIDGQFLTSEQRKNFAKQSERLFSRALNDQTKLTTEFTRLAGEAGVSPSLVIFDRDSTSNAPSATGGLTPEQQQRFDQLKALADQGDI